eukprot:1152230-Pelagomonas_calceolata.AAC.2
MDGFAQNQPFLAPCQGRPLVLCILGVKRTTPKLGNLTGLYCGNADMTSLQFYWFRTGSFDALLRSNSTTFSKVLRANNDMSIFFNAGPQSYWLHARA